MFRQNHLKKFTIISFRNRLRTLCNGFQPIFKASIIVILSLIAKDSWMFKFKDCALVYVVGMLLITLHRRNFYFFSNRSGFRFYDNSFIVVQNRDLYNFSPGFCTSLVCLIAVGVSLVIMVFTGFWDHFSMAVMVEAENRLGGDGFSEWLVEGGGCSGTSWWCFWDHRRRCFHGVVL